MHRRRLLVGCLLPFAVSGCLSAPSASEDSTETGGEFQVAYVIHLEPAENDIDEDEDICECTELTAEAQRELEQAIGEEYRIEDTPELMQRNCHNGYVEHEGKYYWLRISIESE